MSRIEGRIKRFGNFREVSHSLAFSKTLILTVLSFLKNRSLIVLTLALVNRELTYVGCHQLNLFFFSISTLSGDSLLVGA